MTTSFSALKKLEKLLPSLFTKSLTEEEHLVVLVKIHEGFGFPDYVTVRTKLAQHLFSAEVSGAELLRLEEDPAVQSFTISQRLPLVKPPGA